MTPLVRPSSTPDSFYADNTAAWAAMNYDQWHEVFVTKVKGYDWYTCRRALYDCHDTLALHKDLPTDDSYYVKLWAEIDALRERQLQLTKVPT